MRGRILRSSAVMFGKSRKAFPIKEEKQRQRIDEGSNS
jgi:hypothetical protein